MIRQTKINLCRTHEQQTRVKNNWDKHKRHTVRNYSTKEHNIKKLQTLTWLNKHWCLDWQRSKMTLQFHQRVWTYSSVVSSVVSRRNPPLAPNIKNHHKIIKQQFSCLTDREIQNTSVVNLSLVECCIQHINFTFIIKTSLHLITQTTNCAAKTLKSQTDPHHISCIKKFPPPCVQLFRETWIWFTDAPLTYTHHKNDWQLSEESDWQF